MPIVSAHRLQLVHPGLDVRGHDGVFGALDGREMRRVDLIEAAAEPRQSPDVSVDRRPAQILEQVVMQVDAVEARLTGENLLQICEVIVDKVGKRLRWVHAL